MERRNTIQKELVKNAVFELKSHVTADEVYEFIKKNHPTIGKGTVYRNLKILSDEGEILKVEIPDGPDRFDFTLKKHYHIVCIKCGAVLDVDVPVISQLEEKINTKNSMQILGYDILFKGICSSCSGASK